MTNGTRVLIATALPPLLLPSCRIAPVRPTDLFSRLGRIACVVVALALPTFGITVGDTVHRASELRVMQAAVPVFPSDRAAAALKGADGVRP